MFIDLSLACYTQSFLTKACKVSKDNQMTNWTAIKTVFLDKLWREEGTHVQLEVVEGTMRYRSLPMTFPYSTSRDRLSNVTLQVTLLHKLQ